MVKIFRLVIIGCAVGIGSTIFVLFLISASTDNSEQDITPEVQTKGSLEPPQQIVGDLLNQDNWFMLEVESHRQVLNASKPQILELIDAVRTTNSDISMGRKIQLLSVLLQKLAVLDPTHAFETTKTLEPPQRSRCITSIFLEWAQIDLARAVAASSLLTNEERATAISGILESRQDLPIDYVFEIAQPFVHENFVLDHILLRLKANTIQGDFESLWDSSINAIGTERHSDWQPVLQRVALDWVREDGIHALEALAYSSVQSEVLQSIFEFVLGEFALKNPEIAFSFASSQEDIDLKNVSKRILQNWVRSDPIAALTSVRSLKLNHHKLELLETLIENWNLSGSHPLEEYLSEFPPHFRELGNYRIKLGTPDDFSIWDIPLQNNWYED